MLIATGRIQLSFVNNELKDGAISFVAIISSVIYETNFELFD